MGSRYTRRPGILSKGIQMKVAICFSGQMRGDYERNIADVIECYPKADVYFTSWVNQPQHKWVHRYYEELTLHYNPALENADGVPDVYQQWIRTRKAEDERWKHRTKQILGHALVVKDFADDYDVIVRARYDNIVGPAMKEQMSWFIERAFNKKKSLGFFVPRMSCDPTPFLLQQNKHQKQFGLLELNSDRRKKHHVDHMIIHHRDVFNTDYVWKLHDEKRLLVAEYGWWQVLSQPYDDNYEAYKGYVGVQFINAYWKK